MKRKSFLSHIHNLFLLTSLALGTMYNPIQAQRNDAEKVLRNFERKQNASVGLQICSDNGTPLFSYHAQDRFCPASVTKLFTTGAALRLLGPDFRYVTTVFMVGRVQNRILNGYLLVEGSGDPTPDSHYIPDDRNRLQRDLAKALYSMGIDSVSGGVRVDASRFGTQGISNHWPSEDLGHYYGSGIFGFNINDNSLDVKVDSRLSNTRVISVTPTDLPVNRDASFNKATDKTFLLSFPRQNYAYQVEIPAGRSIYSFRSSMPDPATFGAAMLQNALKNEGIRMGGAPVGYYSPEKTPPRKTLLQYKSLPLDTIARITNFRSVNSYAEGLMREVEYRCGGMAAAAAGRPFHVMDYWVGTLKVSPSEIDLYDGCGLAPRGRITPSAVNKLLLDMRKDGDLFFYTLPQAGQEGSVRSLRVPKNLKLQVKSGSINGVMAYAGYAKWQGKIYQIAYFANGQHSNDAARLAFQQFLSSYFR